MAGLCLMAAARLGATPAAPPLYDGVIVQDPYRYLSPASGQAGSPTSAQASQAVTGGTSPQFVVATSESPPQAQLVAPVGAFVLPAGTTSMSVSIEAVPPGAMPSGRDISGNVYRFQVRDEAGADLAVTPGHEPTLLLRAPAGIFSGSIGRLSDGTWQDLTTQSTSQVGIFGTNPSALGDFAVLVSPLGSALGLDPTILAAAALAAGVSVLGLLLVLRRGHRPATPAPAPPPRGRTNAAKRRRRDRRP